MKNTNVKKLRKKTLIIASCAMLVIPSVQAGNWTGNIVDFVGNKSLDKDDWQSFDSQFEFGVIADFIHKDWPVSLAAATYFAGDIEGDMESSNDSFSDKEKAVTIETHIGVRKIFNIQDSPFNPYVGGGMALVTANLERRTGSTLFESNEQ